MARGKMSPPPASALPVVSFTKVQDGLSNKRAGVTDTQARGFGYNDDSDFRRPDRYIRYIEPLESELAVQVEYDMDEQDQEWLDAINMERKQEQCGTVSYEVFEVIMDRLEKEWFDLTKGIPRPEMDLPSEDSTCAICDDAEGENMNAIVFCDGCNLAVHQDCYGVPYIPEGQWLCRKCTVSPENPVACILCPNEGGAFKQTVTGDWVHLLCAIWVPETRVANDVFMEPVTGVEKIPKQRWKLRCSLCDIREGACIQCSKSSCFVAFHPTCARNAKFLMPMKGAAGSEPGMLTCYCEKHLPKEQSDARDAALAQVGSEDPASESKTLSRTARAYAKTYKPGPPLVPAFIVRRITDYIVRVPLRKKPEFLYLVCKYWSLKREARRGAPLLKRLHLEPWTANKGSKTQTEEEKVMKLEHMKYLRTDLERLRLLADMLRKRENIKLKQAETFQDLLQSCLLVHESKLRMTFERIMGYDRNDFFKNPVSKVEVPDYFEVIKKPMCWSMIESQLDKHEYWDVQAFKDDILLVLANAVQYNRYDSPIYKTAHRIRALALPVLAELDSLSISHGHVPEPSSISTETVPTTEEAPVAEPMDIPTTESVEPPATEPMDALIGEAKTALPDIGDLEPPLAVLEALAAPPDDAMREELDIILDGPPLVGLFAYALAEPKPKPPPPPTKPKRDRRAEQLAVHARKRAAKEEAARAKAEERDLAMQAEREAEKAGAEEVAEEVPGVEQEEVAEEDDDLALARALAAKERAELDASPGFRARRTRAAAAAAEAQVPVQPVVEPKTPRRGRPVVTEARPGPADEPPVVETVDKRMLFRNFETGWILPADQKRGGRAAVHVPVVTPKRTMTKAGKKGKQTPSVAEAPVEEPVEEPVAGPSSAAQTEETPMDVEGDPPVVTEGRRPARKPKPKPPPKPVIEVIDTPATRRAKYQQKRLEKAMLMKEQERGTRREGEEQVDQVEERQESPAKDGGTASELSDLSDLSEEEAQQEKEDEEDEEDEGEEEEQQQRVEDVEQPAVEEMGPEEEEESTADEDDDGNEADAEVAAEEEEESGEDEVEPEVEEEEEEEQAAVEQPEAAPGPSSPPRRRGIPKINDPPGPADVVLADGEQLEAGTLVWAKFNTYPWWAAVVYALPDPSVPPRVEAALAAMQKKHKDKRLHLVRFYDEKNSWQWIPTDRLKLLGEDEELDSRMITGKNNTQRFRNPTAMTGCRESYRRAKAEMETADDQADDAVGEIDQEMRQDGEEGEGGGDVEMDFIEAAS